MGHELFPEKLSKVSNACEKLGSDSFRLILLIAVGLTAGAGVCHIVMAAIWPDPTELQLTSFHAMETAWKMGFGAIIGLISARSAMK